MGQGAVCTVSPTPPRGEDGRQPREGRFNDLLRAGLLTGIEGVAIRRVPSEWQGGRLDGLQVLAGLEPNGLAGWDGNLFPRPGVAADSGLARFDIEDAESPKLNPIVALKRALHRIEHGVNGSLGLASGNSGPLHDMVDDV